MSRRTTGLGLHLIKGLQFRHLILSVNELCLFSQRYTNRMKEADVPHTILNLTPMPGPATLATAVFFLHAVIILERAHLHCTIFCMLKVFTSTPLCPSVLIFLRLLIHKESQKLEVSQALPTF